MPREHLPQPNGRICDEGPGKKGGAGEPVSNCLCRHQHRGDWKSGLPSRPTETGGAWDQLRRENRPPDHKGRLCVDDMFDDYKANVLRAMDQCNAWDEEEDSSDDEDDVDGSENSIYATEEEEEITIDDVSFLAVVGGSA